EPLGREEGQRRVGALHLVPGQLAPVLLGDEHVEVHVVVALRVEQHVGPWDVGEGGADRRDRLLPGGHEACSGSGSAGPSPASGGVGTAWTRIRPARRPPRSSAVMRTCSGRTACPASGTRPSWAIRKPATVS